MGKNDIIGIDKVEYQKWLQNLCDEIDRQRLKAVMQLNASTLQHYWWLGNDISEDNPTIGLLLCRSKNNTKVEYALRGMTQPLGVAAYKTKELIENLKSSLPSIDDLEKTLNE